MLRGVTMDGSRKELGIIAALAVAVCCGLPVLLGAATVAVTGVLVGSTLIAVVGIGLSVAAWAKLARRRRAHQAACGLSPQGGPHTLAEQEDRDDEDPSGRERHHEY